MHSPLGLYDFCSRLGRGLCTKGLHSRHFAVWGVTYETSSYNFFRCPETLCVALFANGHSEHLEYCNRPCVTHGVIQILVPDLAGYFRAGVIFEKGLYTDRFDISD